MIIDGDLLKNHIIGLATDLKNVDKNRIEEGKFYAYNNLIKLIEKLGGEE